MTKSVTLQDINKFCYNWLTSASDMAYANIGFKPNEWVMANQNAPAPKLPFGTWYVKEITNIGNKDVNQNGFDSDNGDLSIKNLSFMTFSVEVTSLGYGSNALMAIISQYFDSVQFAYDSLEAGIGYQGHETSRDISSVADAEVREARQFTATFNCIMSLDETIKAIESIKYTTELDDEAGVITIS